MMQLLSVSKILAAVLAAGLFLQGCAAPDGLDAEINAADSAYIRDATAALSYEISPDADPALATRIRALDVSAFTALSTATTDVEAATPAATEDLYTAETAIAALSQALSSNGVK